MSDPQRNAMQTLKSWVVNLRIGNDCRLQSRSAPGISLDSDASSGRIYQGSPMIAKRVVKFALAAMQDFMDSLEHHGHLKLNTELRSKLLTVSAATIDRMLSPVRREAERWGYGFDCVRHGIPCRPGWLSR